MQTRSVDGAFDEALNTPLQENTQRVHVEGEDHEMEEENEPDIPLSDITRQRIALKFVGCVNDTPENTRLIMSCLQRINGLTEKEGQLYLRALSAQNMNALTEDSVSIILKNISQYFVNPKRLDMKKAVVGDRHIRAALHSRLSELFIKMGDFAGVLLFLLYCIESYNGDAISNRLGAPFPDDVRGPESVRENEPVDTLNKT
jgi:hypothetical protein